VYGLVATLSPALLRASILACNALVFTTFVVVSGVTGVTGATCSTVGELLLVFVVVGTTAGVFFAVAGDCCQLLVSQDDVQGTVYHIFVSCVFCSLVSFSAQPVITFVFLFTVTPDFQGVLDGVLVFELVELELDDFEDVAILWS